MRCLPLVPATFIVVSAALAAPQQSPSSQSSDGFDLLKRVAQRYADAKTYALSAIEETTTSGEFQRTWNKTVVAAAEAPDGRYYFEGRGNMGGAIRISDGTTGWKYHIEENHYTAQPIAAEKTKQSQTISNSEIGLLYAQNLRSNLGDIARSLHSASLLREETILVDNNPVLCQVVHVGDADLNRPDPNAQKERTIWIDKQQQTVVKIEELYDVKHSNTPKGLPLSRKSTTVYTKVVLNGEVPDSVFTFTPPSGATLVAQFSDPMDGFGMPTMQGDPIPALKLKSPDGKVVSIESLRGKPVIIDFWATWCAPCVAAMPKLAELYKQGKDRGLVLLSIDQDEDASKATEFLAKHGYDWPNYHDGDGEIAKLMGSSPLPRVVLVDAKGQIAFDGMGGDEGRLLMHLAELGPEFRNLAPKPSEPALGVAAK